jgi:hypothetical protein
MTATVISNDPDLVRSILDDRLSRWARGLLDDPATSEDTQELASRVLETCAAIYASTESEGERLATTLRVAGIESTTTATDQRHSLIIDIAACDAEAAMAVLKDAGYQPGREWSGGAARSFLRFAREAIFTQSGPHSTVVRLRWQQRSSSRSALRSVAQRAITPTPADWATVDLPKSLWWAYGAIRPFRLVAERLGIASDEHGDLEPFLVTPDALLEPLLTVAAVDDTDVFVDIGCGDGRIVIAAARQRGCRAIGVEQSAESAAGARGQVDAAALSERVQIIRADAQDADLSEATIALFFIPMVVAARLVPTVLNKLAPGGRVVLHEQSRLAATLPSPVDSVAIIAADAVTVAHQWNR